MAELSYDKLAPDQIEASLADLDRWNLEGNEISKQFSFEQYMDGLEFAMACGRMAEDLNHHPDIVIGYKKVKVSFSTHDSGGLTEYDFEAARRVDALA